MQEIMDACIPAADPNWWALLSIGCGIFVLGMVLGALVGVAMAHNAERPITEYDPYDPRWPQ